MQVVTGHLKKPKWPPLLLHGLAYYQSYSSATKSPGDRGWKITLLLLLRHLRAEIQAVMKQPVGTDPELCIIASHLKLITRRFTHVCDRCCAIPSAYSAFLRMNQIWWTEAIYFSHLGTRIKNLYHHFCRKHLKWDYLTTRNKAKTPANQLTIMTFSLTSMKWVSFKNVNGLQGLHLNLSGE